MKRLRMLVFPRSLKWLGVGILAICSSAAVASEASITIELNKLEPHDSDCQACFRGNSRAGADCYDPHPKAFEGPRKPEHA